MRRFFIVAALLLAACSRSPESATTADRAGAGAKKPEASIPLFLNWFPEAEHGGFYAASVHGFYKEQGIDVTLHPGGPGLRVLPRVAAEPGSFAIANADELLQAVAEGVPAVAVMASMQDSPRCIMVHEKSGITRLEDLKDLTLAADVSLPYFQALKKSVPLTNVTVVPYNGSVAEFLVKPAFAQQAYVISEPFVAKQKGGDPRCLMTSVTGYNPYSSVLVTSRETLKSRPEVVRKMVAASIRGWQRYLEQPDEANRAIHGANPELELDALRYGAKTIAPLVRPEGAGPEVVGRMTAERWAQLRGQLVDGGAITAGQAPASEAYDVRFLAGDDRRNAP